MNKFKKAVVLFNLGGPDSLDAVKPFLFNLFYDKAILNIPNPFRFLLAIFISSRRAEYAKKIYEKIGGKSPILELTKLQADALELSLNKESGNEFKVFIAMRCWHPLTEDVVSRVKDFNPDEVILLPLYPQFSTTTTASSISHWHKTAHKFNLHAPSRTVCCYPQNQGFIDAYVDLTRKKYEEAVNIAHPIILFSAHGIPLNRVKAGDPYEWQVNQTVKAIVEGLNIENLDYKICYQSKVGPLEWLKPATEDEIIKASTDKKPIVVVPIAFVSEHSETIVELDMMYKELAEQNSCPGYFRVEAVGTHPKFIEGLAELCLNQDNNSYINNNIKECSQKFSKCPCSN
ncbi:ferrochelatase [endosymbiont of Acanthamoeba sp. UWC8]|uniref:ferrochelatase n=1 Tax=endosymbiont of Acanthamoeba sp. UWC8 TaxID=86106 RepID=UPI0004D10D54|nr:ferrochelatase [endosymbiont of Acanthamoeba sp. UWC8]AIF81314.1 ferrochelatase [endosymbiont of Acanthamoeba sp. UWC8]